MARDLVGLLTGIEDTQNPVAVPGIACTGAGPPMPVNILAMSVLAILTTSK